MLTRIISVANQKGGPGKSTVTMHLAGSLSRRGYKVLVADADPQGTASRWAASAHDEKPFPAPVVGLSKADSKIHREIQKFVGEYDFILVDCPAAADSPIPQSAFLVSDLALIPLIPSPPDLWASVAILQVVDNAATVNKNLTARLLMSQVQPKTRLATDVAMILSDFGIPVCDAVICQRQVYRQCAADGLTVHDLGWRARDAVHEVEALTDEVLQIVLEATKNRQEVANG